MVRDRLTLCDLTDHTLAGLGERHNGRGGAIAFGIRNNNGLAALHNCYAAVGCTKVNTNNLAHNVFLLYLNVNRLQMNDGL